MIFPAVVVAFERVVVQPPPVGVFVDILVIERANISLVLPLFVIHVEYEYMLPARAPFRSASVEFQIPPSILSTVFVIKLVNELVPHDITRTAWRRMNAMLYAVMSGNLAAIELVHKFSLQFLQLDLH